MKVARFVQRGCCYFGVALVELRVLPELEPELRGLLELWLAEGGGLLARPPPELLPVLPREPLPELGA